MTKKFLKQLFEKNQFEVLHIKFFDDSKDYAWITVHDTLEKDVFRRYLICDYDIEKTYTYYGMDSIKVRYSVFGMEDIFEGTLIL